MGKQDQIDQLGERVWKLEESLNGSDFPATPGLRNAVLAQHDQLISLRDEVACLRRRVKDVEATETKPESLRQQLVAMRQERDMWRAKAMDAAARATQAVEALDQIRGKAA